MNRNTVVYNAVAVFVLFLLGSFALLKPFPKIQRMGISSFWKKDVRTAMPLKAKEVKLGPI